MKVDDLLTLTGIEKRQLRYLTAEGFVPPPLGGRKTAEYGDEHVAAIRRYKRLRDLGFPPSAIKVFFEKGEPVQVVLLPGVTLSIDPSVVSGAVDAQEMAGRITDIIRDLVTETTIHAPDDCHAED